MSSIDGPRDPFAQNAQGHIMDRIQSTLPAIGEAFGGGFFAGLIRIGDHTYGLLVAPKAEGEIEEKAWGLRAEVPAAMSFFDGAANTVAMADAGSELARWALSLTIGGHSDWFLPARDELELLHRNLKPTQEENYAGSGDNPSSLPVGYAYSPNFPDMTPVEAFQIGGTEAFAPRAYWSSTQYAGYAYYAWGQLFDGGYQGTSGKSFPARARAVRRFLID